MKCELSLDDLADRQLRLEAAQLAVEAHRLMSFDFHAQDNYMTFTKTLFPWLRDGV